MTADAAKILIALQHGDSFFPSGAIAFSWGLETLVVDGIVNDAVALEGFVRGQLLGRWSSFDRPFLAAAMRADAEGAYILDNEVECLSLVAEQRDGSTRAGRSLLGVHERLGTRDAGDYRTAIRNGRAHGHLPIVQGLLFARLELSDRVAQALSAYGVALGAASAAVRLGVIGAMDAQRIIAAVRPQIAEIVAAAVPGVAHAAAYVPQSEIAMMRHETQASRLFAN